MHSSIHSKLKPYNSEVCSVSFTQCQGRHLKTHSKSHSGDQATSEEYVQLHSLTNTNLRDILEFTVGKNHTSVLIIFSYIRPLGKFKNTFSNTLWGEAIQV